MDKDARYRRGFVRANDGTIAMMFALSIFFVMLTVGLAIDGARVFNVSARVSSALDSAALAGAKLFDDEDSTDADIEDRVRRFFTAHVKEGTEDGLTVPEPTVAINRERGEVSVSVNVSMATTFAQLAGIPSFEFPRSAQVRYQQRRIELALVVDVTGSMCAPCDKMTGLKTAAREVVANLINPSIPFGYVRIGLVPYAGSVNAGSYASTVSAGATTDGCVVERPGSTNDTDALPSGANSLRGSSSAENPNYDCPVSPILPLTADRATLESQIDALMPGGWTAGHIGLAWGWYQISHNWSSIWPDLSRPRHPAPNVVKAVLLMTDGDFNTSYLAGPGANQTDIAIAGSSPEQASRLCTNMKAQDIVIYTVAFQAPPAALALLQGCATSAGHSFTAESNAELFAAFRTISERLAALRVTL